MDKYFAFSTWAYGNEPRREEFDKLDDVLALVKKAADEDAGYLNLVVIEGRKLEFEPCKIVESYRVKEHNG